MHQVDLSCSLAPHLGLLSNHVALQPWWWWWLVSAVRSRNHTTQLLISHVRPYRAAHVWFHARSCMFSLNPSCLFSPFSPLLLSPLLIHLVTGEGAGRKCRWGNLTVSSGSFILFFSTLLFSFSFMCLHSSAFPLWQHCFRSLSLPCLSLSPSPFSSESKIWDLFWSLIFNAHFYRRYAVGSHLMVCYVSITFQLMLKSLLFRLHICIWCWQHRNRDVVARSVAYTHPHMHMHVRIKMPTEPSFFFPFPLPPWNKCWYS